LESKGAVVTGGSRGIGRVIANPLPRAGAALWRPLALRSSCRSARALDQKPPAETKEIRTSVFAITRKSRPACRAGSFTSWTMLPISSHGHTRSNATTSTSWASGSKRFRPPPGPACRSAARAGILLLIGTFNPIWGFTFMLARGPGRRACDRSPGEASLRRAKRVPI
jgi:hypothetical protein